MSLPDFYKKASRREQQDFRCFCTGAKPGEPYCPCVMRAKGIYKKDGRWIQPERDLGKVNND